MKKSLWWYEYDRGFGERTIEEMSFQTFPRKQSLTAPTWRSAGAEWATAGKEVATGKARSPMVERRVRPTTSDDDEAERRRWRVPRLGMAELSGVNIWTQSTLAPLANAAVWRAAWCQIVLYLQKKLDCESILSVKEAQEYYTDIELVQPTTVPSY